jgi:ribosome biogenesis GTPase A
MPIQWFPGHMHSTKKALLKRLPDIDVVVELLDARLPGSSSNPLLAELTAGKPALKLLNKQDLADPERTALWLAHFNARPDTQALALHAGMAAPARPLVAACRALVPGRGGMVKPVRVLICGIPNVGKSTLINTLAGQKKASTGDEPGITKTEQKIMLASDFQLYDTPGMLWPRIHVDEAGDHLAASGAVGRNAYDEQEVALSLLGRVRSRYAQPLQARYKLPDISDAQAWPAEVVLAEIGRRRAALMTGGAVNLQKAAEIVLNDFRAGAWGAITLETPEEFAGWAGAAQARDIEREAKRAQLRKARRGARAPSAAGGEEAAEVDPAG